MRMTEEEALSELVRLGWYKPWTNIFYRDGRRVYQLGDQHSRVRLRVLRAESTDSFEQAFEDMRTCGEGTRPSG